MSDNSTASSSLGPAETVCKALLASTGMDSFAELDFCVGRCKDNPGVAPCLSIETSKEAVKNCLSNIFRKSLAAALNTPLLSPVTLHLVEDWATWFLLHLLLG